ncbi:hypothetical protein AVEN_176558-1 [Araneus ventricosus]|uniref:Uncharacterized protein n=1 Tax=Araneus ventricosus TaxID=182803 RepID=A0A4Y2TCT4_ARAVE|nr:hypothetical protein AVEN_176558-1 [Araneus ventricosus]
METKRLMKRKATVRKLALKDVNPDLLDEFKSLRSSVKHNIQKNYNTYLRHMENDLVSDHRRFWSYFKNKNINCPDSLLYNNLRYNNDGDLIILVLFSSLTWTLMEMMNAKTTASVILSKSKMLPMMMWFWQSVN